eukprot:431729_1
MVYFCSLKSWVLMFLYSIVAVLGLDWTIFPNISCTATSFDTCYIDVVKSYSVIQCDHRYSNCIVNNFQSSCDVNTSKTQLHCPSIDCTSCIININFWTECVIIKSYNCQLTQLNVKNTFTHSIIYAPGNSGTLLINADTRPNALQRAFNFNEIYSSNHSTGTKNLIVNGSSGNGNIIYGMYVTDYLNFTCYGTQDCSSNAIICGSKFCNIHCSSDFYGACHNLSVFAMDVSRVNWYCRPDIARSCYNARLWCGNYTHQTYSVWKWDFAMIWYLDSPNCAVNFSIPALSCLFTTSDTCIIIRNIEQYSRDLICDSKYPHCQVQVKGIIDLIDTKKLIIKCPSQLCNSCIISCEEQGSCHNVTIMGYSCKTLVINIKSEQRYMTIYAPDNGGSLYIFTHYINEEVSFFKSHIYSTIGTKNMIFDFAECSQCWYNIINGSHVINHLNMSCDGSYGSCVGTHIICPSRGNCNVDCSSSHSWSCLTLKVRANDGTHGVNWHGCNRAAASSLSCKSAKLYCNQGVSTWVYNRSTEIWKYDNLICVDPPSYAPTATPTVISEAPTFLPSTAPTMSPTASPTSNPVKFLFQSERQYYAIISCSVLGFVFFLCCAIWIIYYYKNKRPLKERNQKSIYIKNACVLLIGIGEYDEDEDLTECQEINVGGHLNDIVEVEYDIKNMTELFQDQLHFDVFPVQINNKPKLRWTEKELQEFLEEKADYLEENIEDGRYYDGLVLIISSHGLPYSVCTSDYGNYSKIAVHRTFSLGHPKTRKYPRFVLLDCCSGSNQMERVHSDVSTMSRGKNISETDIFGADLQQWCSGDDNPDYMLARVSSSNHGFMSKIDKIVGSYLIYGFYQKYTANLDDNQGLFIHEIFDQIQEELHHDGKQLMECVWNNDTRYIKFCERKNTTHKKRSEKYMEVETLNHDSSDDNL